MLAVLVFGVGSVHRGGGVIDGSDELSVLCCECADGCVDELMGDGIGGGSVGKSDGVVEGELMGEIVIGLVLNGKMVSLNLTCLLTNVF